MVLKGVAVNVAPGCYTVNFTLSENSGNTEIPSPWGHTELCLLCTNAFGMISWHQESGWGG